MPDQSIITRAVELGNSDVPALLEYAKALATQQFSIEERNALDLNPLFPLTESTLFTAIVLHCALMFTDNQHIQLIGNTTRQNEDHMYIRYTVLWFPGRGLEEFFDNDNYVNSTKVEQYKEELKEICQIHARHHPEKIRG